MVSAPFSTVYTVYTYAQYCQFPNRKFFFGWRVWRVGDSMSHPHQAKLVRAERFKARGSGRDGSARRTSWAYTYTNRRPRCSIEISLSLIAAAAVLCVAENEQPPNRSAQRRQKPRTEPRAEEARGSK